MGQVVSIQCSIQDVPDLILNISTVVSFCAICGLADKCNSKITVLNVRSFTWIIDVNVFCLKAEEEKNDFTCMQCVL